MNHCWSGFFGDDGLGALIQVVKRGRQVLVQPLLGKVGDGLGVAAEHWGGLLPAHG